MKKILLCLIFIQLSNFSFGQLTVTSGGTPASIVSALVDPILNPSAATIVCGSGQYGTFTSVGAALVKTGSGSGVILSTGKAADAKGNNTASASWNFGVTAADAELSSIASESINDRCYVMFDILPAADTVKINYVFCSEEYYGYCYDASVYNDVFGFFLKKLPAGAYTNFAVIPGTSTPVSVKNIHPGPACTIPPIWPLAGSPATNKNVSYFVDNTGANTDVAYNGMTIPMAASIPVINGQSYRVKVAIGDATDGILDAALFIKTISVAVPVELLSFTAVKNESVNLLSWKTASENNSDKFELLRSSDGIKFDAIGTVKSAGNSSLLNNYSFIDTKPVNGVINYYRLKQIDYDGKVDFSEIRAIKPALTKINIGEVFPNPVKNSLTASIEMPESGSVTAEILDLTGRKVLEETHMLEEGMGSITINTEQLPKGTYFFHVFSENFEGGFKRLVSAK